MSELNEFKKFIRPSFVPLFVSAGLLLCGLISVQVIGNPALLVILVIIAVLSSLFPVLDIIKFNKTYKQFTENGSIERIVEEFQRAKEYENGRLRLGPAHVYGKGSGTVLEYKDIAKAYQYIHKFYSIIEDTRQLRVDTPDGKTITLCKLALHGKSDESLMAIIQVLLSHNPRIKIGYK